MFVSPGIPSRNMEHGRNIHVWIQNPGGQTRIGSLPREQQVLLTHTHSFDTLLMGPPQEQFSQYSANTLPAFCLSVKGEQRVLTGSTTGWQATEPGIGSIFSFIYPVRVHLCALHRHLCLLSASLYASVMSVPRTGRGKQAGNNGVQH